VSCWIGVFKGVVSNIDINIFVNGKVVATYDKTLVNNVKAVDQVAYMHTDALGNIIKPQQLHHPKTSDNFLKFLI
jgi:hypothetical protein